MDNIKVVFTYPNAKLSNLVEEAEDTFTELEATIHFLNGLGLNVITPIDFLTNRTLYVDTRFFTSR